jgi:hypothetical protein
MNRLTPVMVPPVPTPATKMSMAPSVSSQISGPGGPLVDGRVRWVVELAHQEQRRILRRDLLGAHDGALHSERAGRQHQLGAERDEHLSTLEAHRLRHREHAPVAARRRGEREGDARVPARRLDDAPPRLERAALLRFPDHRRPDAALDRIGGVASLDLGEDTRPHALGEPVDLHERRAADAS